MKYVELVPGISSSAIGFGCAPVLGAVDRSTAERALSVAFEEGITHLDVARSYGYGEAESVVGAFARGRRDKLVIASKFGIEATLAARLLSPLKPVVRALRKGRPEASCAPPAGAPPPPPANQIADRFHRRIPLTAEAMRKSIETSLRQLRTDHLDYVFLHEPPSKVTSIDELASMAVTLKKEGKVRAWGLAFMYDQRPVHEEYLSAFDLLQFDNSPRAAHYTRALEERQRAPNVFFSPFRSLGGASMEGVALAHEDLLRKMITDFPGSVVLCSMFSEKHIRKNAQASNLKHQ